MRIDKNSGDWLKAKLKKVKVDAKFFINGLTILVKGVELLVFCLISINV